MNRSVFWNKAVRSGKHSTMVMIVGAGIFALSLTTVCVCNAADKDRAVAADSVKTTDARQIKLVDLGAKQCIPCKKMAPILDELTKDYQGVMVVEFIDVWQKENVAKAKQYGIKSIPSQIFFDADGKELWRHEGYISREDILSKWKSLGYDLEKMKKELTRKK